MVVCRILFAKLLAQAFRYYKILGLIVHLTRSTSSRPRADRTAIPSLSTHLLIRSMAAWRTFEWWNWQHATPTTTIRLGSTRQHGWISTPHTAVLKVAATSTPETMRAF